MALILHSTWRAARSRVKGSLVSRLDLTIIAIKIAMVRIIIAAIKTPDQAGASSAVWPLEPALLVPSKCEVSVASSSSSVANVYVMSSSVSGMSTSRYERRMSVVAGGVPPASASAVLDGSAVVVHGTNVPGKLDINPTRVT